MPNGKWSNFGVDNSSSMHYRKKDILVLREAVTDRFDDKTIRAEAKHFFKLIKSRKKICLRLHCNARNSFLYGNGVKIYKFKANDSEMYTYYVLKIFQKILQLVKRKIKRIEWVRVQFFCSL